MAGERILPEAGHEASLPSRGRRYVGLKYYKPEVIWSQIRIPGILDSRTKAI